MNATMLKDVQQGRYVSLATFRKNGAKVATPVWMAPASPADTQETKQSSQAFYIFSAGKAGKVKRLRNNSEVELALCDFRGDIESDWIAATAELVEDEASIKQALDAMHHKYGWQMWIADIGARVTGKFSKRTYIRVRFKA